MRLKRFEAYSDETLLELLMQDDMSAFEEIYHRYWPRLYTMGYKRTKLREATEELVQDIFSSLWVNRHIVVVQSLSSYLFTSMKYKPALCIRILKRWGKNIYLREYSV